jgi:hypothetical protein
MAAANSKKHKAATPLVSEPECAFLSPPLSAAELKALTTGDKLDKRWSSVEEDGVDVKIQVGKNNTMRTFYCHSALLKMASPVWKDALEGEPDALQHTIDIQDVYPWTFSFLLECIYPQYPAVIETMPPIILRDLFKLAWRYDVKSVHARLLNWFKLQRDFRSCILVDQLSGMHTKELWTRAMYTDMSESFLTHVRTVALTQQNAIDEYWSIFQYLPLTVRKATLFTMLKACCQRPVDVTKELPYV